MADDVDSDMDTNLDADAAPFLKGVLFVFRKVVIVYIFNPPTAQRASKRPMLSRVVYSFCMLYI